MKHLLAVGFFSISLSIIGCATGSGGETGESDLSAQLGENEVLACEMGGAKLALVGGKDGKATLARLAPAKDLFALTGATGKLTASGGRLSWKAGASELELDTSLKGTLEGGAIACKKAAGSEAASWATASGLLTYASEIDGLAQTVTEEMASFDDQSSNQGANHQSAAAPSYVIFAVETARRDALDLGTKASGSAGALPGDDGAELLDEDELSYGGMNAAYGLGGGDDYGEWFQAASDGISLSADVVPALGSTRAGFIAHEKVKALDGLADGSNAIELTVGAWTFLLPGGFSTK